MPSFQGMFCFYFPASSYPFVKITLVANQVEFATHEEGRIYSGYYHVAIAACRTVHMFPDHEELHLLCAFLICDVKFPKIIRYKSYKFNVNDFTRLLNWQSQLAGLFSCNNILTLNEWDNLQHPKQIKPSHQLLSVDRNTLINNIGQYKVPTVCLNVLYLNIKKYEFTISNNYMQVIYLMQYV